MSGSKLASASARLRSGRSFLLSLLLLSVLVGLLPGPAQAEPLPMTDAPPAEEPGAVPPSDGPRFLISALIFDYPLGGGEGDPLNRQITLLREAIEAYEKKNPDFPTLPELSVLLFELGLTDEGYVAPREGVPTVFLSANDIAKTPEAERIPFFASALRSINLQVVENYNRWGFISVRVTPSAKAVAKITASTAAKKYEPLRVEIWTAVVTSVRTIASGERIESETRINNEAHQRIIANSPAQHGALLARQDLDEYVYRLSRHPGRRVDMAISSAGEVGEAEVDYLVTENKAWTAYYQGGNTGTKSTGEWRNRFGFVHNQLTNRDDILSVDYVTSDFSKTQAVTSSYDAPLSGDRLRYRLYTTLSEFTASDVGRSDQKFSGKSWMVGGDLVSNVYQRERLFLDMFVGARWQYIKVENKIPPLTVTGRANFFLPHTGLRLERITETGITQGTVEAEWGFPLIGGSEGMELARLGRLDVDEEWMAIRWNFSQSFFLDPLFYKEQEKGPNAKRASRTLAHEIVVSLRGQNTLGNRVVPQHEQVIGGLYSVRGYDEAAAAGDSSFLGSAEYRFHIPWAWGAPDLDPEPKEGEEGAERPSKSALPGYMDLFGSAFRYRPTQPYGRADWDLIFRLFYDEGRTINHDRLSIERDNTLRSVGAGLEFQLKRNLNLRLDWGHALEDVSRVSGDIKAGDKLHFVVTLLY